MLFFNRSTSMSRIRFFVVAVLASVATMTATAGDIASLPVLDSLSGPAHHLSLINRKNIHKETKAISSGNVELNQDSIYLTISKFYLNQFRHFQDPQAPYFLFMSKDAHLAMGIGGTVRMRGFYDWNGSLQAAGFIPTLISTQKDPTQMERLYFTPAGCALFFTMIGRDTPVGDFQAFIQAGFSGYENVGFKLKKAYFTIADWTVGYATSTFVDPSAQPPTIDSQGSNGATSKTSVLVRYMHTFKDPHWTIAASAELPSAQVDDEDNVTKKCAEFFPDVAMFGQYQWDRGASHVRLSAMTGIMKYRDLLTLSNRNVMKWGAQLSAVVHAGNALKFYGDVAVGQGNGSYLNDLSAGAFDLIADPGNQGHLYAPTSLGLTFGASYYFRHNIFANLALGEMRNFYKAGSPGDSYKYGLYGALNLFWDITPRIQVGAEYLLGKRVNIDSSKGSANRVDVLFQFQF